MAPDALPVKLRQARGAMSLADAAERSGISEDRIRSYEEGDRQPYGKTLRRLAQVYGVTAAELAATSGPARSLGVRPKEAPKPLRRRRRRAAAAAAGAPLEQRIEIPIDVESSQPIRLVIELILRPNRPLKPTVAPAEHVEPPRAETRPPAVEAATEAPPSRNGAVPEGDPLAEIRRAWTDYRRSR
jgi:transcriptional regulator with XRE-family HTH domain